MVGLNIALLSSYLWSYDVYNHLEFWSVIIYEEIRCCCCYVKQEIKTYILWDTYQESKSKHLFEINPI